MLGFNDRVWIAGKWAFHFSEIKYNLKLSKQGEIGIPAEMIKYYYLANWNL